MLGHSFKKPMDQLHAWIDVVNNRAIEAVLGMYSTDHVLILAFRHTQCVTRPLADNTLNNGLLVRA